MNLNNPTANQSIQMDWRSVLEALYGVAVATAHPKTCLPTRLPDLQKYSSVKVISLGKAAFSCAQVVEEQWPNANISGIAVSPHKVNVSCQRIKTVQTSHPDVSDASIDAGQYVLNIAKSANNDDLLLILLSGGASASVALPIDGLTAAEKNKITKALMLRGASIQELNVVRKHLSKLKGGQLAVAGANAKEILTLAISDVTNDDPAVIGSGLTVSDPSTIEDAKTVLQKYGVEYSGNFSDTIDKDHSVFTKCRYEIIANTPFAINGAAEFAKQLGIMPDVLNCNAVGDAALNGKAQARFITRMYTRRGPKPKLLLFGGEYTVNVRGDGQGGPNQHFLLSLLHALPDDVKVYGLSADTDGQDGTGNAAGAWFTPESKEQIKEMGLDPLRYLENNDSFGFFQKLGTVIQAMPTHTNVNDFRAILIPAIE